jgi:SH3 domain-containing kinase-binding protein 1
MSTDPTPTEKGNVARLVNRLSKDISVTGSATSSKSEVNMRRGGQTRTAVVRFSYTAQHDDELSLQEGDIIDVQEDVEDGWARGSINGKEGVFPTNFVSFANSPVANAINASTIGLPKVPEEEKSMDLLSETEKVDQSGNMLPSVIKNQRRAMSTIVTSLDNANNTTLKATPKEQAKVLYDYNAEHPDELSLKEGTIITVINKKCDDEGWFEGEYAGKKGIFPENFVKLLPLSGPTEKPSLALGTTTPPMLPAKPSKAVFPPPVANGRDLPSAKQPVTTFPITNTSSALTTSTPAAEERKSMIAGLQSKLFPAGFPLRKPPAFGTADSSEGGTTAPVFRANAVSNEREKTTSSSGDEDSTKLSCPTKGRPKQPKKRPPSMVSSRHSIKMTSAPVEEPSPTSTPTTAASSMAPIGFKTEIKTEVISPVPKSTTTHTPKGITTITPSAGTAKLRTAVPAPATSTASVISPPLPTTSLISTANESDQFISRKEFEAFRKEMQAKIEELTLKMEQLKRAQSD